MDPLDQHPCGFVLFFSLFPKMQSVERSSSAYLPLAVRSGIVFVLQRVTERSLRWISSTPFQNEATTRKNVFVIGVNGRRPVHDNGLVYRGPDRLWFERVRGWLSWSQHFLFKHHVLPQSQSHPLSIGTAPHLVAVYDLFPGRNSHFKRKTSLEDHCHYRIFRIWIAISKMYNIFFFMCW